MRLNLFNADLFSTKVRIEELQTTLSENNTWEENCVPWRDVWASIQLKSIGVTKSLYLFIVKWKGEFPKKFRVVFQDKIFIPTQEASFDYKNDLVIFHAR